MKVQQISCNYPYKDSIIIHEGIVNMAQHSKDTIEVLRLILEKEHSRGFTHDEALEVGESLISYFKTLADQDDATVLGLQET